MMSNNKLNNKIESLKNIGLSAADRASLRNQISEHIDANQPVSSPWAPILSPLQKLGRSSAVSVAAVLLLVGGVSMAAENALPGDLLYSFKLNVNESFLSLTSLSPNSGAEHESRLANRRIAELEALAFRGDLNEEVSADLTAAISKHTISARKEIAKISDRGEEGDAASLETELLSSLEVHSDILANLASDNGQQASTTANAAARLRQVAQDKTSAAVSAVASTQEGHRTGLENSRGHLSSVQTKRLLERTAERLTLARSQFDGEASSIENQRVKESVEGLLTASADTVDRAIDLINEDEYKAAGPLLREALTYAHRATVLMNARRALESSNVALEKLLDSNIFSVASSSTNTQVGGADVVPDNESKIEEPTSIMTNDEEASSTTSTTPAVYGTSTSATSSTTSTTSASSSKVRGKQSFTRQSSVNAETTKKIEEVLQRVQETLDNHTPKGFLPARTSHGEEN